MPRKKALDSHALALEQVEPLIREIRGEKVILDSDLARLYGVTTKRLNQQVKRKLERFPADFVFQVTSEEDEAVRLQIATLIESNRSQIVTASSGRSSMRLQIATASKRNIRYLPYVFTEHGATWKWRMPKCECGSEMP